VANAFRFSFRVAVANGDAVTHSVTDAQHFAHESSDIAFRHIIRIVFVFSVVVNVR